MIDDTNLITQAVVAGLETSVQVLSDQVVQADASLDSLATQLTAAITTSVGIQRDRLTAHVNALYETAHGGIAASNVEYRDSGHALVGDRTIQLVIGGTTYHIPASESPDDLCHSQCHSNCHCRGAW